MSDINNGMKICKMCKLGKDKIKCYDNKFFKYCKNCVKIMNDYGVRDGERRGFSLGYKYAMELNK